MSYMSEKIKQQNSPDIYSTITEAYNITAENIATKLNENEALKKNIVSCLASYMKVRLDEAEELEGMDNIQFDDSLISDDEKDQLDGIAANFISNLGVQTEDVSINAIPNIVANSTGAASATNKGIDLGDYASKFMDKTGITGFGRGIKSIGKSTMDRIKSSIDVGTLKNKAEIAKSQRAIDNFKYDKNTGLWDKIKEIASASGEKAMQLGNDLIENIKTHPGIAAGVAVGAAGLIYLIKRILSKKKEEAVQESVAITLSTLKNVNDALKQMNESNTAEIVRYIAGSLYKDLN